MTLLYGFLYEDFVSMDLRLKSFIIRNVGNGIGRGNKEGRMKNVEVRRQEEILIIIRKSIIIVLDQFLEFH